MDCCNQDSWIKFELLANNFFENLSNYCGLQVGNKWNIEKAAKK